MTPSEIAEWLDALVVDEVDYEERNIHKAAATIRAQAEALKIATVALEFYGNSDPKNAGTGVAIVALDALGRKDLVRIKEVW